MAETSSSDPQTAPKRRWYAPTSAKFLVALMVMQGILFLSAHYRWLWFNERKGYTVLITMATTAIALVLLITTVPVSRFFRSKSQLSLATLLLMVSAMAIPFAWLAREMEMAKRQWEARKIIEAHRGVASYEAPDVRVVEPTDLGSILGQDFFNDVKYVELHNSVDSDLKITRQFNRLNHLRLTQSDVSSAGLEQLEGFDQLQILDLDQTQVSDEGLRHLGKLPQLVILSLNTTRISDSGVEHVKVLKQLECLDIGKTQVTDTGLTCIQCLASLKLLILTDTHVTDMGVGKLQEALPECKIAGRGPSRARFSAQPIR